MAQKQNDRPYECWFQYWKSKHMIRKCQANDSLYYWNPFRLYTYIYIFYYTLLYALVWLLSSHFLFFSTSSSSFSLFFFYIFFVFVYSSLHISPVLLLSILLKLLLFNSLLYVIPHMCTHIFNFTCVVVLVGYSYIAVRYGCVCILVLTRPDDYYCFAQFFFLLHFIFITNK